MQVFSVMCNIFVLVKSCNALCQNGGECVHYTPVYRPDNPHAEGIPYCQCRLGYTGLLCEICKFNNMIAISDNAIMHEKGNSGQQVLCNQ